MAVYEIPRVRGQDAYQAQLAQKQAYNLAISGGETIMSTVEIAHRFIDPTGNASFKRSIGQAAIEEAQKGDPSNLVTGLVKKFNQIG